MSLFAIAIHITESKGFPSPTLEFFLHTVRLPFSFSSQGQYFLALLGRGENYNGGAKIAGSILRSIPCKVSKRRRLSSVSQQGSGLMEERKKEVVARSSRVVEEVVLGRRRSSKVASEKIPPSHLCLNAPPYMDSDSDRRNNNNNNGKGPKPFQVI